MKKQFLKLTAFLLSGAMLLNVGCTDYDDDIRDIQSQIDNLTSVTIADLQTQLANANSAISGINTTIGELQAADKANADLISQLRQDLEKAEAALRQDMEKADAANAKAVQDAITYLEGLNKKNADAIEALKTSLSDLSGKVSALESTHKQDIQAVRDLYTSLSDALDAYKLAQALTDKAQDDKISALDARLTALDKTGGEIDQLKGRIKTLEDADLINRMTAVEGILGADIAQVLKDAGYSSISAMIADYVTVKADVYDLKTNFNSKVDAAIAAASDEGNYYKITNVADLKTAIQSLHDGIEAANNKIAALQKDLAAQIQSIVSVPEYTDGSFDLQIYTVDNKVVGNSVRLVYQITPAAIAETVVAAGIDAVELVVKEAKTRAAAPSAQINSIKSGADAGTIVVMATINNYPANAAVNVALKFKNKVRSEEGSVLENDVISDYAGVVAVDAADYKAVTFEVEGTDEYRVAWNTPKGESLRTIFDDAHVFAKVDGVKYELSDLKEFVGVDFGSVQYKVATTATPASGVFTVTNPAKSAYAAFPAKALTVAFAKDLAAENVGNNVVCKAQFQVKVGTSYANPVAVTATYKVCNAKGATFVFGTLQMPWDYTWLMSVQNDMGGYYNLQPNPAIPAADLAGNQLGEVAVSVEGNETFQPSLFEEIVNRGTCEKNKVSGKEIPVCVSAKASEVALIALVSFKEATYEWGKTYNVEYVYTYNNVDYTVKGTVVLGAAPANIKKEVSVPMGWDDASASVKLADLYKEHPAGFENANVFQSAVLQIGMDASGNGSNALLAGPATTNYRYNSATKKYNAAINGTVASLKINPDFSVAPAATPAGTISGKIGRDAIEKDGDSFQQTWTMTTWYGQKIEIVATYNVVLPTSSVFNMIAKDIYIKDGQVTAEGYIGTDAAGNAVWTVETKEEISNYFEWTKGAYTDLDLYFKKLSVDNDRNSNTLGKYFANVNVNDTTNPKIEWTYDVTTEREVEVLAYVGLGARQINVAESKFTVVTPDPIATFEHSNLETTYIVNEDGDKSVNVNLLEGMSIIDADRTPNQWIVAKDDAAGIPAHIATAKGMFSYVFATKQLGGYVYVDGINFKIVDNDQLDNVNIGTDGHMTYIPVGGSTLQRDVNVKIEARIKYWLGEKTVSFTVTIKK